MVYKARFIDPETHAKDPASYERQGVFPRDPLLKSFLRSGPAVGATLHLLWGFLNNRSQDDCYNIIEDYADRGGDNGLTWKCLRCACGLPTSTTSAAADGPMSKQVSGAPSTPVASTSTRTPDMATRTSAPGSSIGIFDPVRRESSRHIRDSDGLVMWALDYAVRDRHSSHICTRMSGI